MDVPKGLDLSWEMLVFLGTICSIAFLGAWRLFSVRNADHVKIAYDIAKVKSDLDERITRNKEDLIAKVDGKCESIKKEIDRNERENDNQYKELHGRMNKGTDELSEVKGELREVRGELKIISKLVIDKVKI